MSGPPRHKDGYRQVLSHEAELQVSWTHEQTGLRYAVVLIAIQGERERTVRVWDNHMGTHHMHRHSATGQKRQGEHFHDGTDQEALDAAIATARDGYERMIDG